MADDLFPYTGLPGIQRDGTQLDSPHYSDGEWVRFRKGRPRKMGGYRGMTTKLFGPARSALVDSRNGVNSVHTFSEWGVQRLQFGPSGAGGSVENRTPAGFQRDPRLTWSHAVMTSSSGGSYSALLAASSPDLDAIDSDEPGRLYTGSMTNSQALTVVSDENGPIQVSGGITVLQPIAVAYGSNGLIKTSKPNDFSPTGWTPGGGSLANEANVAGTKFVYGAPVRGGGQTPAGLFWSLDALVRMSYDTSANAFRFDTLSNPTSILSKKCVVENDGKFFWIGTDRFLFYNGVVQELPNPMNADWFFENLNYAHRNKVWGTKITRWGEIWWFFPMGKSTECNHAIIYNYLEGVWYDAAKMRSAGDQAQIFPYPIWAGREDAMETIVLPVGVQRALTAQAAAAATSLALPTVDIQPGWLVSGPAGIEPGTVVDAITNASALTIDPATTAVIAQGVSVDFSSMLSPFVIGETVTGSVSGAVGTVQQVSATQLNLTQVTGTFALGDVLEGSLNGLADLIAAPYSQTLETLYQQEVGKDKVIEDRVEAIRASVTTKDFGFAVAAPYEDAPKTSNLMTRLVRVEPDYRQVGDLTLEVLGRSFPKDEPRVLAQQTAKENGPGFLDMRNAQERILRLRVTSNVQGGDFFQGQVQLQLEPGDERSSERV